MKVLTTLFLISILSVSGFAQKTVKSKSGSIDLNRSPGGDDAVCTALENESMKVLKQQDNHVLVTADCGQGWVAKKAIVYEKLTGNKSMTLDEVDIMGWLDNPSAVFVLDDNSEEVEGIDLNRNFNEYLKHTMDRETIEMRNQDN